MTVKLYVEGDGDSDALQTECRKGFSLLLERAGMKGRMPRVVAAGARHQAFEAFCHALSVAGPDELPLLLVDSETAVRVPSKWQHVKERAGDNWEQPPNATENHLFLMVQCMETWFMADKGKLKDYFGPRFMDGPLPGNMAIEEIPKEEVLRALRNASRHCQKSEYNKSRHSFAILATLDPQCIRSVSPHAEQFFSNLLSF